MCKLSLEVHTFEKENVVLVFKYCDSTRKPKLQTYQKLVKIIFVRYFIRGHIDRNSHHFFQLLGGERFSFFRDQLCHIFAVNESLTLLVQHAERFQQLFRRGWFQSMWVENCTTYVS